MLTGECLCGTVKYQIDGDLNTMYHCYCSQCRKLTGASFATNASVDARLFSITAGQDSLALVGHDPHIRYHCGNCYSWIYGDSGDYAGVIFIPCGTLNEAPKSRSITASVWIPRQPGWKSEMTCRNTPARCRHNYWE